MYLCCSSFFLLFSFDLGIMVLNKLVILNEILKNSYN